MATYLLRPGDGGRDIAIPFGKTTIGRGPFLGVSDKRVSRSHAVLEVTDGNLTVLPLHTNPTFYKTSVKEKFVALKKNEIQNLVNGNVISLLPDSFCFEIINEVATFSKNDLTTEKANAFKEITAEDLSSVELAADTEEKAQACSRLSSVSFFDEFLDNKPMMEANLTTKTSKDDEKESFLGTHSMPTTSKECTVSPTKPQIEPAQPLQKTRKLPSWLTNSTSSEASSSVKKEGNRKGKAPAASKVGKSAQKMTVQPQKKQRRTVSDEEFIANDDDDDDDDDDEESRHSRGKGRITKSKKRTSADMEENDNDFQPTGYKKTKQVTVNGDKDSIKGTAKNKPLKPAKLVATDDLSSESEEDLIPAASEKKETKATDHDKDKSENSILPPCPYGSKCYRKNPVHFKEYSHLDKDRKGDSERDKAAGDSDDDDDDRPECPYGMSCYRKNPQHIKDFKHSKVPDHPKPWSKSKHKSVVAYESDDDGPNTYDYDDSFIDDAEEEESSYSVGSDDSDWQPQGGDDEDDDDDVNELLSEARGFLHSKKMAKPV